ncbi:hypothetical protein [Lutibacter citreus]|uniref:hypothetical protein n=1 Tax=Lutibacter citreus TaxID=2138210 RepID=UPI000DBE3D13|nr:hypothetical protein [Lutibacter citreus]
MNLRIISALLLIITISCTTSKKVDFKYDTENQKIEFAVQQLKKALEGNEKFDSNYKNITFEFLLKPNEIASEGFTISENNGKITITASDSNGLMYGGFEIAEQITLHGKISEIKKEPYIKKRGIKFNIPLDARTPSYDDTGDAAQENYAEMWEWEFWEEYLDKLAIDRYNTLTLWNPHPFPSMIKMQNYPDIALNDVYVTTLKPKGLESEWAEPQMVSTNTVENVKLVKKISIEEKIAFWQKVMEHAKNRGIDIYFFTWNLCANGAAKPLKPFYRTYNQPIWDEEPGKYGITNQMDNPINVAYYREAVKTFLLTYPNVKGIGVTAGEHMKDVAGDYTREQWIWETYGQGILDAKKEQPNRKINFIHRVWNTNLKKVMKYWKDYPDSFDASYKYAKARLYSSPFLNFADEHIEAMKEFKLKSWWNLRNDDIFVYRWGDPDYVRSFIGHFQKEHTIGFYMGSDGYVWGKEFNSKNPKLSGELEINKHWFNSMLWGRLSYDNSLKNNFFIDKLKNHYPGTDANILFTTWQTASKIIPKVNCYHWQNWDYQWSVEACIDVRNGFHNVEMFMNNPTLVDSNMLSPNAYVKGVNDKSLSNEITPYQIAKELNNFADETISGVQKIISTNETAELITLKDDMLAMAYLGKYYASKIEASTELAFLKATKVESHRAKAITHLEKALEYWTEYTLISEKNYRPQMLARTKELDWRMRLKDVEKDIEIAKNIKFD